MRRNLREDREEAVFVSLSAQAYVAIIVGVVHLATY
jgi:hypothetical protein